MTQKLFLTMLLAAMFGCKDDSGIQSPIPLGAAAGKVVGVLSDQPISNVYVTIETNSAKNTISNTLGEFTFADLPAGNYNFILSKNGFKIDTVLVAVTADDTAEFIDSLIYNTPENGLISYYRFDGNANDLGPGGNHGTTSNVSMAPDRFGNTNRAFTFNGTSSYVNLGNGATLSPTRGLSISAWIKYQGEGVYGTIASRWGYPPYGSTYALMVLYNTILFMTSDLQRTEIWYTPAVSIVGNWTHLVATWNGRRMRLYENGTQVATALADGIFPYPIYPTVVGGTPNGPPNGFPGVIDDLRFYNRALTPQEIQTLYMER